MESSENNIKEKLLIINQSARKWFKIDCDHNLDPNECAVFKKIAESYDNEHKAIRSNMDICSKLFETKTNFKYRLQKYYNCMKVSEDSYRTLIENYYEKFQSKDSYKQ